MFKKYNTTKFIQSEGYFVIFLVLNLFSWFLSKYFNELIIYKTFHIGIIFSILVLCIYFGLLTHLSFKEKETYFLIPGIIGSLFATNSHISLVNVPYYQILLLIITIIPGIIFIIKNKVKISLKKLGLGFLLLACCGVLSLINAPKGFGFLNYFLAFNWFLYFGLYLIIVNTNKSNLVDYLAKTMIYLGLFLSIQVIYTAISENFFETFKPIYLLGWGISNEAATLIFCCIPFLFYRMTKKDEDILILFFTLLIFILAEFLLMSRAGYVFTFLMCGISFALTWKYKEDKRILKTVLIIVGFVIAIVCIIKFNEIIKLIKDTFVDGLSLTGRIDLYKLALKKFMEHPLIGSSLITAEDNGRFLIYHSTFFTALATTGLIGLSSLIFHMIQKYKLLFSNLNPFVMFSLVYFILSDLYGLLDNTYSALHYSSIMVIILAIIEVSYEKDVTIQENDKTLINT